jgi:carbamoyltransferase
MSRKGYILGISAFYHDSAAALIHNGEIIAAAQEERFSRHKGDDSFPLQAVLYCLNEGGIDLAELDSIVFYDKPILKFDRIIANYIHTAPRGLRSFIRAVPYWLKEKLWTEDLIRSELNYRGNIFFTQHHLSHAASAFYPSPYESAAVLTVDGAGEWTTTAIGVGSGSELRLLKSLEFPHSMGLLYSAFTYYCGFRVNSGEYKLMGLAPYGSPVYLDTIKRYLVRLSDDGSFRLNEKYFGYLAGLRMITRKFEKLFGRPALHPDETPDQFYMDIAASIQELFNEHLVALAREAKRVTGENKLVMAGGVALNCVSNSRILAESGFSDVWVQPAAGDAGGALGAALYAHYAYYTNPRVVSGKDFQKASLLGPSYSDEQAAEMLTGMGAMFTCLPMQKMVQRVAEELAQGKVVGWFQGRMEFGPRALGSRSILGDPRSEQMQTIMNLKIKFRESFRPFAPIVLEERVSDFFEWNRSSPYMLFVAPVSHTIRKHVDETGKTGIDLLRQVRSTIPAVTHLDYTARLQTVSKCDHPLLHDLLSAFDARTGCPVLINTSFNVRGEPIVCSPSDAYRCFMGTNMDLLVVGNCIMYKTDQPTMEMDEWEKTLTRD